MAKKPEKKDEKLPFSHGDECPGLAGVDWVNGRAPRFTEALTLVHLWQPSEEAAESFRRLNALQTRLAGKLAIVALCGTYASDEDEEDDDGESSGARRFVARHGVKFSVGVASDDTWEDFEREDYAPLFFLFDSQKKLLWRGPELAMIAVIEALAAGKMTAATMKELADLRERLDAVEDDDDLDYDDKVKLQHKLASQILDRNPADTVILERALTHAQIDGDRKKFGALLARIDLAHWSPDDASSLASTLIDCTTAPHLRPAALALKLAEHAEKCSWLGGRSLCECAEVHAFVGDFQGAIRLLERAEKLDEDEDSLYKPGELLAAMRERAALHTARCK